MSEYLTYELVTSAWNESSSYWYSVCFGAIENFFSETETRPSGKVVSNVLLAAFTVNSVHQPTRWLCLSAVRCCTVRFLPETAAYKGLMEAVRHNQTVNVWAVKPKQCAKMLFDFSPSISSFHTTQSNLIYVIISKILINAGLRRDM